MHNCPCPSDCHTVTWNQIRSLFRAHNILHLCLSINPFGIVGEEERTADVRLGLTR
jgi:hypothetical protein